MPIAGERTPGEPGWLLERQLDRLVARDAPGAKLLELQSVDQKGPARPKAGELTVGARGDWLRLRMRVEDGELVPLVFKEPHGRVDLQLVAVRGGERVPPTDIPLGDAVAKHDDAAALVRRVLGGVRVQLGTDLR